MRKRRLAFFGIALVSGVGWACADDYVDAPNEVQGIDGGPTPAQDGPTILRPADPPGITIGKVVVARGESARATFTVTRARHDGPLDIVASGLPAGITVQPVKLPIDTSAGEVEITAAVTAAEGATTIDLALLDQNTKLASASTIVEIGPLRAGNLDPSFGTNGVVELNIPRSLMAFSEDGALYVLATTGLARWTKDGARDPGYGPMSNLPATFTPSAMLATSNGQVYFGGYHLSSGVTTPAAYRTSATGKSVDTKFGVDGKAVIPTTSTHGHAFAIGLTPTGFYAFVRDGTTGPTSVARLSLAGQPDLDYGFNGFVTLPIEPTAPEIAQFESTGTDQFFATLSDRSDTGLPFLRAYEGTADKLLLIRGGYAGTPTAVAWDGTSPLFARHLDAGVEIARLDDAGLSQTFDAGATVNAINVDPEGRILLTGCAGAASSWTRYFSDGGVDPDYRNSSTPEMSCILLSRVTEKFIYLAGVGGSPEMLKLARLVR